MDSDNNEKGKLILKRIENSCYYFFFFKFKIILDK